jgi:hypothetical protein
MVLLRIDLVRLRVERDPESEKIELSIFKRVVENQTRGGMESHGM